jgi:hypothetical protein
LETYVIPRSVTAEQAEDLRTYLKAREPHAVTVKFDPLDQEAAQYGGQIFGAIKESEWNVDINTTDDEPKPRNAVGLVIQEIGVNNKPKPNDPKHDPRSIIDEGFRSAHIFVNGGGGAGAGDYKLFIIVGHRPVALIRDPSILNRLGHWLIRLGGGM